MITVGPFTIVCTAPEDAAAFLKLFGKTATRNNLTVAFDRGATIRRKGATLPRVTPVQDIDIADFMGRGKPLPGVPRTKTP